MDIKDFWDMCEYASTRWKGNFSNREICEHAYDLFLEYDEASRTDNLDIGGPLDKFIIELVEDYNNGVYEVEDWLEGLSWNLGYLGIDDLVKSYS